MQNVLVISDNHGLTEEMTVIKNRHQVDYMIHCGDSELEKDARELAGFIKVAGNCDYGTSLPNEEMVMIDGYSFFITHGHLYNVRPNLNKLAYRAQELNAQIICFGHTHIAGAQKIGNQLFVNPGSIRLPRNRIEKTYAIIRWETSNDIQVNFYTVAGELVEDLSYHTNLSN